MSDTGFKTASTIVTSTNWTNLTALRIASSDDSYATTLGGLDALAVVSTFGFGVPSGSTINGIEITIEAKMSFDVLSVPLSLSWNSGTNYTATKSNTWTTTEQVFTYGGAADTWGHTWSTSELADGTFYLKIDPPSTAFTGSLDRVAIRVYYTASAGVSPSSSISPSASISPSSSASASLSPSASRSPSASISPSASASMSPSSSISASVSASLSPSSSLSSSPSASMSPSASLSPSASRSPSASLSSSPSSSLSPSASVSASPSQAFTPPGSVIIATKQTDRVLAVKAPVDELRIVD